jgi:lipopolysaccharide export system permease protein
MEVAPRFRVAFTDLRFKLQMQFSNFQIPEGRYIHDFPGYIFYAGRNRKGLLEDVIVFALKDGTNPVKTIRAPRGKIEANPATHQINLTLYDAKVLTFNGDKTVTGFVGELQVQPDPPKTTQRAPKIDDMTFTQLCQEMVDLERRINLPVPIARLSAEELKARKQELQKQKKDLVAPMLFQIHRQVAFSFACFGFTLLGIPLGIRVHRRETNVGIAIALLLVATYYSFVLLAQGLETRPQWAPHLIVWLPNFLFQAVGAVLLWRANRGT